MKVVIASDSYKGTDSSAEVAEALEEGIHRVDKAVEVVKLTVADGGEGMVEALVPDRNQWVTLEVQDPLGRPHQGSYAIREGRGIIEMAAASGLPLLREEERDPSKTSTFGTGQLIKDALERGCTEILIGIGGSATNDGGVGMARALGVRFLNKAGQEVEQGGGALGQLASIDTTGLHPLVGKADIKVACDVDNPLCGDQGASAIYGPQKGADPAMVERLDKNLVHLASLVRELQGEDKAPIPGAGAAGGLGFGLMAFLGAKLQRGIDLILDAVGFDKALEGADLIITGEGRIDGQSIRGKVPVGIAQRAKERGIPVLVIAGSLGPQIDRLYPLGIGAAMSVVDRAKPREEAMAL